ncbi:MAG: DUF3842 family protein [Saccharofermentanales bacterium]
MKIAVIDGQGGGIGREIVEKLRKRLPDDIEIIALGTNSVATTSMIKAGAARGATGENAIIHNAAKADIILGVIGIIAANSMMGELTKEMAAAVTQSDALKILIPINRCNIEIAGVDKNMLIPDLIGEAVSNVIETIKNYKK